MDGYDDSSIEQVCTMLWDETLGLSLERTDERPSDISEPIVEGHVQISGTWHGTIILQCSSRAASLAASRMFNDVGTPSREDIRDTVAELTNILAGNFKALVSENGSILSLPVVVEGVGFEVHVPNAEVIERVPLQAGGMPVKVTVFKAVSAELRRSRLTEPRSAIAT